MQIFSMFLCIRAMFNNYSTCIFLYLVSISLSFYIQETINLLNLQIKMVLNNTGLTKDEFFNSLNKVTVKEYNMGQGNMPTGDYVLGQMEYIRNTMYYLTTLFSLAV